ncbi:MAG: hypothetical protein MJZ64_00445 [Paludibacteraceae bacterium]|nr:hypothetical protein [Paludibacteraceae bacterium]
MTDVLLDICHNHLSNNLLEFDLDEYSTNQAMKKIENTLRETCPHYQPLSQSVSYLFDELICNMQQHSQANKGYLYAFYNKEEKRIEIVLADYGISIYGSYAHTKKYLDLIGNSDAKALSLAKDGFSTKDLPETENRGYGISSNTKMITDGLGGEIAIYSGNALLVQTPSDIKLLELPEQLDMKGTIIIARIPTDIPHNYNFYEYIS